MPDNLAPPSWDAAQRRPHQGGQAKGYDKGGLPVSVSVEWMADTGAELSVVTKDVAAWTVVGGNPARVIRTLSEDER